MEQGPLSGIKVLEFAQLVAGPFCAKLMADLGAEVIKVEPCNEGDEARKRGPFLNDSPHPERSGLFLYNNTNKLGITLNINSQEGRKIFKELVKQADVLIEDNPPSRMEELGLDYPGLKKENPGLVMTSITPFGHTGHYRDYKAYPLNVFHSGAEGYVTPGGSTFPDRPPLKIGKYVGEYESAISATGATLIAVYFQMASGLGQHIDFSKQEALMMLCPWEISRLANKGYLVTRFTRGFRFAGVLPCKDGYIELCPYKDDEWDRLVGLMGNPDWAKDDALKAHAVREKRASELKSNIGQWSIQFTKNEIYHKAQAKHCPIAPYYRLDEVANCPQLKARSFFVEIEHAQTGSLKYPSSPYKFSRTLLNARQAAPLLGEHNEKIYCGRLGYSSQELVKLRAAGII